MAEITISEPSVEGLVIEYDPIDGSITAVKTTVAWFTEYRDMNEYLRKEIDTWVLFNQGDKNKFQSLVDKVLDSIDA